MQITEIASINNRVFRTVGSPLVLPKHHTCLISPVNHDTIRMTIDHVSIKHKNVNSIQYRVANEKVRFARLDHSHSGNVCTILSYQVMKNDEI